MIDVLKEIKIEESLFSVLKSGFYVLVSTKGMEKYSKKNLLIIVPDVFINHSKKLLLMLADYILNHYKENDIELYELTINDEYPPVNLKMISLNNLAYYLVGSKNILEERTQDIISKNLKIRTENDIGIPKPKLYVIKGGKL